MRYKDGAQEGTRTPTPDKGKRILSRSRAHPLKGDVRLVNSFISDRESRGLSPNTIKFYEGYLTRFVNTLSVPILQQTKHDISEFITSRRCNAGGKHAYFRVLRTFYNWCKSEELLTDTPMKNIKAPKVPRPLRYSVNLSNLKVLLESCGEVKETLVVSLLADTGLRLSELAGVEVSDINLSSNTITVWGKGSTQRLVTYGSFTRDIIDKYILFYRPKSKLFELKSRGIAQILSRMEIRTGIKCNAHSFRRTFATESIRNGMNLFHVQSLLGHSSLTMTRIYSEQVNSQDAVDAYKPIVR